MSDDTKPREWWILRWSEDWLMDSLEEAQNLFEDFNAKEIVHVVEHSAYEAVLKEQDSLKQQLEAKLEWDRCMELAVLLSKYEAALTELSNMVGFSEIMRLHAKAALGLRGVRQSNLTPLGMAVDQARQEHARLKPLLSWLVEIAEKADSVIWINECRCDEAYTGRGMHGPNALCGEMDELASALQALRDEVERQPQVVASEALKKFRGDRHG